MRASLTRLTPAGFITAVVGGILLSGAPAYGQVDSYVELLRSDIRTKKQEILTEVMQFSDEQASTFWPIYREYDLELSKYADRRLALIKDYAANFETMTDDKARELADRSFKLEEERVKVRREYFEKVRKALDPIIAAKFVQVERTVGLLIDLQISAELPLMDRGGGEK
jgi:hypothetical protein